MNLRGSIVLLLLFLIYFGKTAHCPRKQPNRCGSSWSDANAKCGQCCKRSRHCTDDPNDTGCWTGLSETPCEGSNAPTTTPTTSNPTTTSPTTSDPTTATPTTAMPTTSPPTTLHPTTAMPTAPTTKTPTTASPTTSDPTTAMPTAPTTKTPTTATPTTAAPTTALPTTSHPTTAMPTAPTTKAPTTKTPTTATPTTAMPTAPTTKTPTTASPTTGTPTTSDPTTATPTAPTTATPICTSRCGSSWSEAYAKCGQCCNFPSDCTIDPADINCWADLSTTPCTMGTPTAAPTDPSTAPTLAPTMPTLPPITAQPTLPPTTAQPTLPPTTAQPTQSTASPTNGPTRDRPMNHVGDYRISSISGCGSGKYVSLSFDDGPANGAGDETQTIIDKLTARGIVATFYVSPAAWGGDQWSLDQRCPLFQALNDAGMEIQSHSWSHPDFANAALSNAAIFEELERTREEIVRCGGAEPTVFRPPYGSLSKAQAEYIVALGYILSLWNIDSNDWRTPNDFAQISSYIDLSLYGGDSVNILMHDRNVYAILDDIIDMFVAEGYEFITASECFAYCDTIDADGVCVDMHGNDQYMIDSWR